MYDLIELAVGLCNVYFSCLALGSKSYGKSISREWNIKSLKVGAQWGQAPNFLQVRNMPLLCMQF